MEISSNHAVRHHRAFYCPAQLKLPAILQNLLKSIIVFAVSSKALLVQYPRQWLCICLLCASPLSVSIAAEDSSATLPISSTTPSSTSTTTSSATSSSAPNSTTQISHLADYEVPKDVPDGLPDHIVGDLGVGVYSSNMSIGTTGTQTYPLPYAFFDYERFFARIDTFGIKTAKIGYGYLELAGQVNLDDYTRKSAITGATYSKRDPVPIGIGTFQETPIGGFFLHGYQDVDHSQGQIYEFSYFAQFETVAQINLYPMVGAEHLSQSYANYYYGVSAKASQTLGYAQYTAPATTNLSAGLMIDIPIVNQWHFNLFGKRKFMGSGISESPIMARGYQDSLIGSLVYRFE